MPACTSGLGEASPRQLHHAGRCEGVAEHRSSCLPLLGMISWRIGRSLQLDAEKEEIIGDPEATKLLRRVYRAPWKYPV